MVEVAEVMAKEDLEAVGVAMAVEVGVMEVVVTTMAEHLLGTHSRYRAVPNVALRCTSGS